MSIQALLGILFIIFFFKVIPHNERPLQENFLSLGKTVTAKMQYVITDMFQTWPL